MRRAIARQAHAIGISCLRQCFDLLGGMERCVLAVTLQHAVGAGPELPLAQHQRK